MKKTIARLKNKKVLKGLLLILGLVLIVGGLLYLLKTTGRVSIEDSLVQAPISSIASNNPGKLIAIDVYEGEKVKKGDPLAIVGTQTITADTDGLVIMANNQMGSLISTQNPVVQMINPQDMRIAGTIDENKGLHDIAVGQVVSFTIDALPGKIFWGYVDEVSPSAKQTQLAFSISSERPTQQFVVYARFNANEYPEIKNGMSAKVTIYTNTKTP